MNALELVLGAARSGKSGYALDIAKGFGNAVTWIATADAYDEEMQDRINKHKAERPSEWKTIESPLYLSSALLKGAKINQCTVVDCLTLWLSNWLCRDDEAGFLQEREKVIDALQHLSGRILLVSNEVGWGIVPENALSRRFRDATGKLHQDIAKIASRVTLVVAGIPMHIKT